MTSYWHPFADMGAVEAGGELAIVYGEGAYVFDAAGKRYFDSKHSHRSLRQETSTWFAQRVLVGIGPTR